MGTRCSSIALELLRSCYTSSKHLLTCAIGQEACNDGRYACALKPPLGTWATLTTELNQERPCGLSRAYTCQPPPCLDYARACQWCWNVVAASDVP